MINVLSTQKMGLDIVRYTTKLLPLSKSHIFQHNSSIEHPNLTNKVVSSKAKESK